MKLDLASLILAGIPPTQARMFLDPLRAACDRFDIVTGPRLAGFVAQCRVESGDFVKLEENLNYRTPEVLDRIFSAVNGRDDAARLVLAGPKAIGNRVYAGRNGNGSEATGDGFRYRGRGLIQLTGRANYHDAGMELGFNYIEAPDLVATPQHACLTAAWYWHVRKLNHLADSAQWDAITRAVNGPGMLHADLRRQYSEEGVQFFA